MFLFFLIFVSSWFLNHSLFLINFVLEYIQVVGGGHSYDVLFWVPGGVQDLLVEVQAVHADFIFLPFAAGADLAGFEHGTGFTVLPRRLQCDVPACVPVEHPKEVVVGARHNGTEEEGRAGPMREEEKNKDQSPFTYYEFQVT